MSWQAQALIDLKAIQHNYRQAQKLAAGRLLAVIKADAYGHGALAVAQALPDADGFAVARIQEALALRAGGIAQPIVVFCGIEPGEDPLPWLQADIWPVVQQLWQLEPLLQAIQIMPVPLWIKLDSGMNRLGISESDIATIQARLQRCAQPPACVWMTHLACAAQPGHPHTLAQLQRFSQWTQTLAQPQQISIAHSAGLLAWPQTASDWSRPGIMLYGAQAVTGCCIHQQRLKPAMTLQAPVIALRKVYPGDCVGYGATHTVTAPCTLATVAIGYGDGYPRVDAPVQAWMQGQRIELIGRVSMDLTTFDVSQVPQVAIGDWVELWGKHISVDDIAQASNTIGYELLTRVSPRVVRLYH